MYLSTERCRLKRYKSISDPNLSHSCAGDRPQRKHTSSAHDTECHAPSTAYKHIRFTYRRAQQQNPGASATCRGASQRARPDRAHPRCLACTTAASVEKIGRHWLPCAAAGLLHDRRRGGALRPLLAAAGRSRRQVLLTREKQASSAHGQPPPRPHLSRVHIGCQSRGPSSRRVGPRAGERKAKAGARGGCARSKTLERTEIDLSTSGFDR